MVVARSLVRNDRARCLRSEAYRAHLDVTQSDTSSTNLAPSSLSLGDALSTPSNGGSLKSSCTTSRTHVTAAVGSTRKSTGWQARPVASPLMRGRGQVSKTSSATTWGADSAHGFSFDIDEPRLRHPPQEITRMASSPESSPRIAFRMIEQSAPGRRKVKRRISMPSRGVGGVSHTPPFSESRQAQDVPLQMVQPPSRQTLGPQPPPLQTQSPPLPSRQTLSPQPPSRQTLSPRLGERQLVSGLRSVPTPLSPRMDPGTRSRSTSVTRVVVSPPIPGPSRYAVPMSPRQLSPSRCASPRQTLKAFPSPAVGSTMPAPFCQQQPPPQVPAWAAPLPRCRSRAQTPTTRICAGFASAPTLSQVRSMELPAAVHTTEPTNVARTQGVAEIVDFLSVPTQYGTPVDLESVSRQSSSLTSLTNWLQHDSRRLVPEKQGRKLPFAARSHELARAAEEAARALEEARFELSETRAQLDDCWGQENENALLDELLQTAAEAVSMEVSQPVSEIRFVETPESCEGLWDTRWANMLQVLDDGIGSMTVAMGEDAAKASSSSPGTRLCRNVGTPKRLAAGDEPYESVHMHACPCGHIILVGEAICRNCGAWHPDLLEVPDDIDRPSYLHHIADRSANFRPVRSRSSTPRSCPVPRLLPRTRPSQKKPVSLAKLFNKTTWLVPRLEEGFSE